MPPAPRPRLAAPAALRSLGALALLASTISNPARAATAPTTQPAPRAPATRCAAPKTSATRPDPKASKADAVQPDLNPSSFVALAKASPTKTDPKSSAIKPDPKASSTKPDPKASSTKPDPKASATKPDPKASSTKTDPKASSTKTDPKATSTKTDPKATSTKSDPKASAIKPDPKATSTKPDPKASAIKPDPKATSTKPDPKATSTKSDPKATSTKTDPKASSTKPDPKAGATKPDPKASSTKPDPKASSTKPDPKVSSTKPDPKATPAKPDPKAPPKPDPKASPTKPDPAPGPAPALDPAPAPAPSTAGGYWLSARLLGPSDARAAALEAMSLGTGVDGAPDAAVAGQVQTLPEAIAWVARWSFAGDPPPRPALDPADVPLYEGPAPVPGGPLFTTHGAVVHALIVRGRNVDGSARAIRWPQPAAEVTPPDLQWLPAALLAERAPLFAAPSARVPPAAERFALARRGGHLWVLGMLDRCSTAAGERVCLRWAQVVARDGDEFRGGYLPAHQLAFVDGWRRGSGAAPRAQVIASGTVGKRAQFMLVARTRDGGLHRRTLEAPMNGDAYPAARVRIDGDWATIEFTGSAVQRVALDASLDARQR